MSASSCNIASRSALFGPVFGDIVDDSADLHPAATRTKEWQRIQEIVATIVPRLIQPSGGRRHTTACPSPRPWDPSRTQDRMLVTSASPRRMRSRCRAAAKAMGGGEGLVVNRLAHRERLLRWARGVIATPKFVRVVLRCTALAHEGCNHEPDRSINTEYSSQSKPVDYPLYCARRLCP